MVFQSGKHHVYCAIPTENIFQNELRLQIIHHADVEVFFISFTLQNIDVVEVQLAWTGLPSRSSELIATITARLLPPRRDTARQSSLSADAPSEDWPQNALQALFRESPAGRCFEARTGYCLAAQGTYQPVSRLKGLIFRNLSARLAGSEKFMKYL